MDNIKEPKLSLTIIFILTAVVSFWFYITPIISTGNSNQEAVKKLLIITANVGFWGMVYRISRHAQFYLNGKPGANFIRVILTSSFVLIFILLYSFSSSFVSQPTSKSSTDDEALNDLINEVVKEGKIKK